MPIYAYRCEACGFAKDVLQKMSDPQLTVCLSCGAPSFKKQVTAAGFQLKGTGWYATDFRNGAGTTAPAVGAAGESGKDGKDGKSGEKTQQGDKAENGGKGGKGDGGAATAPAPASAGDKPAPATTATASAKSGSGSGAGSGNAAPSSTGNTPSTS